MVREDAAYNQGFADGLALQEELRALVVKGGRIWREAQ